MKFSQRHSTGLIYGAVAAASYGTNPLFALPLYSSGIGVNSVLFYRYGLAVFIYALWIIFVKKTPLTVPKSAIVALFFLGLLFSASSLLLFESFKYIDAGIACTILFIYPLLVAIIMAMFFKEKITKSVVFSILLISAGLTLLYKGNPAAGLNIRGVMTVFLSALSYAVYIVGVKKINSVRHLKSNILTFYVMLFGLFIYIFNLKFCTQLQMLTSPFMWLCALALAIIPTVVSIETITNAIKLIGSTKTALLGALEPITALFFGVVVFHEHLSLRIAEGVFLILMGVAVIVLRKNKK